MKEVNAAFCRREMKKVIIIASLVTTLVIGIIITGVVLFNSRVLQEINPEGDAVTVAPDMQTAAEIKEKVSNFLVLGVADDESERDDTRLTDVMMLVSMDLENGSASILQIPRDTYVGDLTPNTKINAVYQNGADSSYGGLDGVIRYVHDTFQMKIDHYVTMKMNNFAEIVDALGGVKMNVPEKMSYKGVTVEPGEQVLNGKEALVVVRTRKIYFDGDLGRLDAQKIFLSSLAKQCLDADLGTMTKLVPAIMNSVNTDLTPAEALGFYNKLKDIELENIVIATTPGTDGMFEGQSIFSIYPEHMAAMLNDYFRPHSSPVPAEMLQLTTAFEYEPTLEELPVEVKKFDYLLLDEEGQEAADAASAAALEGAGESSDAESDIENVK